MIFSVRNRPATESVMLKVHNVKLSFGIWLVLSELKTVDFIYSPFPFHFYSPFDLCFLFLFSILRIQERDRVTVTSRDMVTVTTTSHMTHGKTQKVQEGQYHNMWLFRVGQKQLAQTMRFWYIRQTILYRALYQVLLCKPYTRFLLLTNSKVSSP